MKIWKTMAQKALAVWSQELSLTDTSGWPMGEGGSEAGESVTARRVLGLSTAWACVNLLAGLLGSVPARILQPGSDGLDIVVRDHPLARIVSQSPNALQTALDFWEFIQASLELWGNAYAQIKRTADGVRIVSLEPLRPEFVVVRKNAKGELVYSWSDDKGQPVEKGQADIFHVRGFGGGPICGMSTLEFGREVFGLALAVTKSAAKTFKQGVRPSGILKFDDWLDTENRDRVTAALEKQHAGAYQDGKPLVLEGGVTWEQISMKPADAEMLASRSFSVEEVCRMFQVPPVLIGHTEKVSAWGSGISQITEGFVKFTFLRRCRRIEQAVGKQLLSPADRSAGVKMEFNLEGLLRGSPKERSDFYRAMVPRIMSVNEARRLENLPPVPGGDMPLVQQQDIPLDQLVLSIRDGGEGDGNAAS